MKQIACLAILAIALMPAEWTGEATQSAPVPLSYEALVKLLDYDRAAPVDLQLDRQSRGADRAAGGAHLTRGPAFGEAQLVVASAG